MSWWIRLEHPETKELAEVENFQEGGTQLVGGSTKAELNVTYNYGKHFRFDELHGRKAKDTIVKLLDAVSNLGKDRDEDYWNPTQGNVGYACNILLGWAMKNPNYIWDVS